MTAVLRNRSAFRGRLYAICLTVIATPFATSVVGDSSITTRLIGVLAGGVVLLGVHGVYDPDRLGFSESSETVVFIAVLAAVASVLFVV